MTPRAMGTPRTMGNGQGAVHIIGGGLAGLACALECASAGLAVTLYEAAPHPGGRCRSFRDETLGAVLDNGSHLLLSGNRAALRYLKLGGGLDEMRELRPAAFPFRDLRDGSTWRLRPNRGPVPWWVAAPSRRAPGSCGTDYLRVLALRRGGTVEHALGAQDPLFERLWSPLCAAVLNTPPEHAEARLLWTALRQTLLGGEARCRPILAKTTLDAAFIAPTMETLRRSGARIHLRRRLKGLEHDGRDVDALAFEGEKVELAPTDHVVLAVPPRIAAMLLPGLIPGFAMQGIVNVHFRVDAPDAPPFLGLVGGTAQWLFVRDGVVSATVSAAGSLLEHPSHEIAQRLWVDVVRALDLASGPPPPSQVIKERQATIAQTPEQERLRPQAETPWRNLHLAGDWTATGLPCTIESACVSGFAAAARIPGVNAVCGGKTAAHPSQAGRRSISV